MSEPTMADVEAERLADLRTAIQAGVDDVHAGRCDDIEDATAWVQEIAETVTTKSVT